MKLRQIIPNYIKLYEFLSKGPNSNEAINLGHICFRNHAWSDYAFTKKQQRSIQFSRAPFSTVKEKATDHLLQKVDAEDSIISDDDQRGVKQEVDFPKFYFFVVGFFN